jgi:hypothetical protein
MSEEAALLCLPGGVRVAAFRYYGEHSWRVNIRQDGDEVRRWQSECKSCYAALTEGREVAERMEMEINRERREKDEKGMDAKGAKREETNGAGT